VSSPKSVTVVPVIFMSSNRNDSSDSTGTATSRYLVLTLVEVTLAEMSTRLLPVAWLVAEVSSSWTVTL
jgi:hypothetical protein